MYEYKTAEVIDTQMAFIDHGEGDPIVFLHGNPTSSYLWRNVMPHLEGQGRLLAPDLVGMGRSAKLESGDYSFTNHYRYLSAWLGQMDLGDHIVLVLHDWGSGLGFHWTHQHQDRVEGIVFMEALVRPLTMSDLGPDEAAFFGAVRSDAGEQMILEENAFVEQLLPSAILRDLSPEEMDTYRSPYLAAGEGRRPTLTWPREIPVEGQPADVQAIVSDYYGWLQSSDDLPKLWIEAEPGLFNAGPVGDDIRQLPSLEVETVAGLHFVQEDSPDAIGSAASDFVRRLRGGGAV